MDTDDGTGVGGGDRPWYHSASELPDNHMHSTDIDYPHISSSDNDSSRIDPSGVSMTSNDPNEREDGARASQPGGQGHDVSNVWLEEPRQRHSNCRQEMPTLDEPGGAGEREREAEGIEDELTELRGRFSSPQPSVDPMWYRRGSGCEETANMPTMTTSIGRAGESEEDMKRTLPQKSVTWADQEPVVVLSPRHSLESFSSQSICLEPPSASSSRQSSREGSPAATTGQGYVEHTQLTGRQLGGFVGTPPLMTRRRPAPEGMGAVVMFPSPCPLRKVSSSGSLSPPSPTSPLGSSSSQHSGVAPPPPPPHSARSHTHTGHSLTPLPPPYW